MRLFVGLFITFSLGALSACSRSRSVGSDGGVGRDGAVDGALVDGAMPDAADASTTPEEIRAYLEELADAQCQRTIRCDSVSVLPPRPSCHPGWVDDVAAAFEGGGTLDVDRAAECLAAFEAPCDAATVVPDCGLDAIRGTGTTGDPCLLDESCADDHYCAVSTCPTCQPRVGLGAPCSWSPSCDRELRCATNDGDSSRRCLRPREIGETCGPDDVCEVDEGGRGLCDEGVCRFAREGEACATDGPACGLELRCDTRADVCEAWGREGDACGGAGDPPCALDFVCQERICRAPARADGALCQSRDHCPPEAPFCAGVPGRCHASARGVRCTSDADCGQAGWCAGGFRCAARGELGGPCDAEMLCPEGTQCAATDEGDRCRTIVGPGARCDGDRICVLGFGCDDGRCEPLPTQGEPCEDACALGVCRDGVCELLDAGEPCEPTVAWNVGSPLDATGSLGRQCTGACSSRWRSEPGTCIEPSALGERCGVCELGALCAPVDGELRCVPFTCE